MLTPPKWHFAWLKSQRILNNAPKKIIFQKPSSNVLDDIRKSCSSLSKELSLEALSCWKMWLECEKDENWKNLDICYFAIQPLIKKKFHPLVHDSDVIVAKLNVIWCALEKVQSFMHCEGPQHILEFFLKSCGNWLSHFDKIDEDVVHLILKLLCSLFSSSGDISFRNKNFPLLNTLFLPDKYFTRLVDLFLEIFHNGVMLKEKSELLHIWKHFLEHCEKSFKFIPVSGWHKIFKLIKYICMNENETFYNKISLLHICCTSMKSALYSPGLIDVCNRKTLAKALLEIALILCRSSREESYCFQVFSYCKEICYILSKNFVSKSGLDFFLNLLPKIEEVNCKTLFWGLWCGLSELFEEENKNLSLNEYGKLELKIFRKLRAVAVNFELDKFHMNCRSILVIEKQLVFFRIGSICDDCPICFSKLRILMRSQEKDRENISKAISCDIKGFISEETIPKIEYLQCSNETESYFTKVANFAGPVETVKTAKTTKAKFFSEDKDWIKNRTEKFDSRIYMTFMNVNRRLISSYDNRRSILFAPMHLKRILDEIITKSNGNNDKSSQTLVENVRKLQRKTQDGQIFAPIRFLVSLKGRKGVGFWGVARRFWETLDEVVHDVDFDGNLNAAISKNENSIFCFCMFLLLGNFAKNLFFESLEEGTKEENGTSEKIKLSLQIVNFMKNVIHCKEKHSRADFVADISKVLPNCNENPLMFLMKLNFVNKLDECGRECVFKGFSNEESTLNNNSVIIKYSDKFENKFRGLKKNLRNRRKRKRRGNRNRQKPGSGGLYLGKRIFGNDNPKVIPIHPYESWDCTTLSAVETKVNGTREVEDFKALSDLNEDLRTAKDIGKGSEDSSRDRKTSEESDIDNGSAGPHARKLHSFKKPGMKRGAVPEKEEGSPWEETKEKTGKNIHPPRAFYSLRVRPLQRPKKFKSMEFDVSKGKGFKEEVENAGKDEAPVTESSESLVGTEESDEAENGTADGVDREVVHVIYSMILALEREEEHERESAKLRIKLEVKVKEEEKEEEENVSWQAKSARGIKRRMEPMDDWKNAKQLKMEGPAAGSAEEKPMSCTGGNLKCQVLTAQNRGSRMLALISESPRIGHFHDSSLPPKSLTVKFPPHRMNSRASKMLALLPGMQEPDSKGDASCLNETLGKEDENRPDGIGGCNPGKAHHLMLRKSILYETARHRLRQRKSIRFDDERNETALYFSDSPSLLILRSPS